MPFSNPLVGGTVLIRPAIRSRNYVPGVSGWTINADGTAEFVDVSLRGELFVTDPDGSYIRIFDEQPGQGAMIRMNPADLAGTVFTSAQLYAGRITDQPFALWASPVAGGGAAAAIELWGGVLPGSPNTACDIGATVITLDGIVICSNALYSRGAAVPTVSALTNTVGPAVAQTTASTIYATLTNAAGAAATVAIDKEYAATETNLRVRVDMSTFANAINTRMELQALEPVTGTIVFLRPFFHNGVNVHADCSAAADLTGLAAGSYSIVVQWRRSPAAGGTLTRNGDDNLTIEVYEVAA